MELNLNTNTRGKTLLQKLKLFFTKPTELFKDYREKPAWALKLFIIAGLMSLYSLATKIMGKDLYIELLEKKAASMSPEQAEAVRASAGFMNSPLMNAMTAVIGALSVIIIIFILALVYMAFIKLFGGKVKYMQVVSVYTLSYMAVCIGTLAKLAYMYITKNLVYLNLEPTYMDALYNNLDPFIIWQAILMVFGISAVADIPEKKSTIIVVIMWLLSFGVSIVPILLVK